MLFSKFLAEYNTFTGKLLRSDPFKGYVHERGRVDNILAALGSSDRVFDLLYDVLNETLVGLGRSGGGRCLNALADKSEDEGDCLLAGCAVLLFLDAVQELCPTQNFARVRAPRYLMVNKMASSLNNLGMAFDLAFAKDSSAVSDSRDLAFHMLDKLAGAGVLVQEIRRVSGKTEYFVRPNVKFVDVPGNDALVYGVPGTLFVRKQKPVYVDKHFTAFSPVITNNSNNSFQSGVTNVESLLVLGRTKFKVDAAAADYVLGEMRSRFPELKNLRTSSDVLALLRAERRDAAVPVGTADDAWDQGGWGDDAPLEYTSERALLRGGRLSPVGGGNSWSFEAEAETYASHLYNMYGILLLLERPELSRNGFYYRFSMDFRGRVYCNSPCGYTYNKPLRYALLYADCTPDGRAVEAPRSWEEECLDYAPESLVSTADTTLKKRVLVHSLVELGKINKSKSGRMGYGDFVKEGAALYVSEARLGDFEDSLCLNYYKSAIARGLAGEEYGYIYYKDATASGLQVLGILLGCRDGAVAERLNLTSTTHWYDTYTYIIERFLGSGDVQPEVLHLFTRKNLKKTIMIINYKGSYSNCLRSFVKSAGVALGTPLYEAVLPEFRKFYKYLLGIFEGQEFFQTPSSQLMSLLNKNGRLAEAFGSPHVVSGNRRKDAWRVSALSRLGAGHTAISASSSVTVGFEPINYGFKLCTNFEIVMSDGFRISYNYMEPESRRIDVKPKIGDGGMIKTWRAKYGDLFIAACDGEPKRGSIKLVGPSDRLDARRMERAFRANLTHSLDASIARSIITRAGSPILTIHDCVGVSVYGVNGLKEICRAAYSQMRFRCGVDEYCITADVTGDFTMS